MPGSAGVRGLQRAVGSNNKKSVYGPPRGLVVIKQNAGVEMTNYVDRFFAAVTVLSGNGHIKQRLIKAYEEHLDDIDEDELPIASKQTFADLRQSLHSVSPLNGEGPVCASVRKMSPADASECASQVVMLFAELARLRDDTQVGLPLGDGESLRVPPFLLKSV